MTERLLIDTEVLVEYLRGRDAAIEYFEGLAQELSVSSITVAEIYAGARATHEHSALELLFQGLAVVPVTAEIARDAGQLRHRFGPSHGTGLADAIIAATAIALGATLATFNTERFPMLAAVSAPYPRP